MKNLSVKEIKHINPTSLAEVRHLLDLHTVNNSVDVLNWKDFPYLPDVHFRIAFSEDLVLLNYEVGEKYILANETNINGDVYKDSTVEFFISLDGKNYYNFEFSCIGVIHLAYGSGRENRTFVDPEIIKTIEIESSLGNQPFNEKKGDFKWELTARIPITCFEFDKLKSFKGLKANANFYKCGDGTSEPHYITWNPVGTKSPDYHCPEYFGNLIFE